MSNLLAAAQSREEPLTDVKITINGTLEMTPPRFAKVKMEINAPYEDRAQMEKLVTIAERLASSPTHSRIRSM